MGGDSEVREGLTACLFIKEVNECFLDTYPVMTAPKHRRESLFISQQPQTSEKRKKKN